MFDNQLIAAVENLIRGAKKHLLLVSPFIDLDPRIKDALIEKKSNSNFVLDVLFGKNENNLYKSIKKDSIDFLKQFPNIEIRYNDRLHAKFYQNDYEFIMTSMNLYNYSLANNIEVGIKSKYASKGVFGKVMNVAEGIVSQSVDKINEGILGMEIGIHPVEKFKLIFDNSTLKYKTEPVYTEKTGLSKLFGKKKLEAYEVLEDQFAEQSNNIEQNEQPIEIKTTTIITTSQTVITEIRCISASQIARTLGCQAKEISSFMEDKGLIRNDKITEAGKLKGLIMKKYMGIDYVAYPVTLEELKELDGLNL